MVFGSQWEGMCDGVIRSRILFSLEQLSYKLFAGYSNGNNNLAILAQIFLQWKTNSSLYRQNQSQVKPRVRLKATPPYLLTYSLTY